MPGAASAYTGGKHPGAKVPCHFCPIQGIRILDTSNLSFYLPLQRPPGYRPSQFTIDDLPLRTPRQYLSQARQVDLAPTVKRQGQLSKRYGINYTPIMSKAPGVTLPFSSPFDFMHMLENTCSNYVGHICGEFKGLDAGRESYILPPAIWKEIGRATTNATSTIPSVFGRRILDVSKERTFFTCESYLVWCTLYAPILLRNRFSRPKYYAHWMLFVSIINRCICFRTTKAERDQLRVDIKKWYQEYEE
ncbi:hypothetical protein M407DRAFT_80249 [Tulasnella calospora MUT 4182]|uniref:Uncharacterized protein n=1 Tax=Tulasnella calospora MUT 4182 TaxID=1051891 RepID=A0A0C3KJE4_9AGAM|nr:hypothetical protein M407DRAFT_80249 [Tulasnella calospora MUT 4182]